MPSPGFEPSATTFNVFPVFVTRAKIEAFRGQNLSIFLGRYFHYILPRVCRHRFFNLKVDSF